ncbi:MAG: glycosyltransferase, partial [Candidatus Aegiribacteria sp.]|nr:glycosyltransferase [Candidatus Aegiribacteria sp.]MBD3294791.1 glycosyltransferase [Candidatus Fermentibacteria bacterium]
MISRNTLAEAVPDNAESVDIIIPVFNEEDILRDQLSAVVSVLPSTFRLLVVENGSTDSTLNILRELADRWELMDVLNLPEPNYGLAMKRGLAHSHSDVVITDDLDVMDVDFWLRGLRLLSREGVELVQGSKVLAGRNDRRPPMRKIATRALTLLLR